MQYARLSDDPAKAVAAALDGDALGLAVETSGSTGAPREVLISTAAIEASCDATLDRLGGHGSWLLAIPATRIGGALVVARAIRAGTPLAAVPPGPFTADAFAGAVDALAAERPGRLYTSLVPTQVARLAASTTGKDALARFDAVLVGGAALPHHDVDAPLISTYGASETCGGCVYDGVPLDGVGVRIADDGRIWISGPTLADGYADGDDGSFTESDGTRWFRSSDAGTWDGRLTVLGRADDVIITGGVKAHPVRVERALASLPWVAEAAVAGVPDAEWGERVVAWVVPDGPVPPIGQARRELAETLAPHELPREIVSAISLPRGPGGKIDRPALRELAAKHRGTDR